MKSRARHLLLASIIFEFSSISFAQPAPPKLPSGGKASDLEINPHTTGNTGGDGGQTHNYISTDPLTVNCQTSSQITTSALCVRGVTTLGGIDNATVANFNLDLSAAGKQGVALYSGVVSQAGTSQGWALNTVSHFEHGSGGGFGYELDLNNWDCDPGPWSALNVSCNKVFDGLLFEAASPYPMSKAISIAAIINGSSFGWREGIAAVGPVLIDDMIRDATSSLISYDIEGTHTIGVDFTNGTYSQAAIRMKYNQGISWTQGAGPNVSIYMDNNSTFHISTTNGMLVTGPALFYNPAVPGMTTGINASGAEIAWNRETQGETDFFNGRGLGVGGFMFYNVDQTGTLVTTFGGFDATGNWSTSGGLNPTLSLTLNDGQSVKWKMTTAGQYVSLYHVNSASKTYLDVNGVHKCSITDAGAAVCVGGFTTGTP